MQAITTPEPDPPITLTPLPPVDDRGPQRVRRVAPWLGVAIAGLILGLAVPRPAEPLPPPVSITPDLATNLQWMFEAALGYPAIDEFGEPVAPAAGQLVVESVSVADPVSGPITATVLVDGTPITYDVVVERIDRGWRVRATEISG